MCLLVAQCTFRSREFNYDHPSRFISLPLLFLPIYLRLGSVGVGVLLQECIFSSRATSTLTSFLPLFVRQQTKKKTALLSRFHGGSAEQTGTGSALQNICSRRIYS